MVFNFKKTESSTYFFFLAEGEIIIFYHCRKICILWRQLQVLFSTDLDVPSISLQSAIFGFLDDDSEHKLFLNPILLIFKNTILEETKFSILTYLKLY